jgi:putative flippase GtrA
MALIREFGLFVIVGLVAAVGHYGTLMALAGGLHADPVLASALGFLVGGLISYVLNYHLTFRATRHHAVALPMFFAVAGIGFLLNGAAMTVLTKLAALHYLAAQVLTTGLLLLWHFAANRMWTFRPVAGR